MRVAALYDVHGNTPALRAVLDEIDGDADAYVFDGDVFWGSWARETRELVRDWPLTLSLDGVVYCHATPVRDDIVVLPRLEGSDWSVFTVPLTVCGHTHVQFRTERIVDPGSVGLPTVRPSAWWAVFEDGNVELRTTAHDTVATADAMRGSGMPEADGLGGELLRPPPVEQLLERIG